MTPRAAGGHHHDVIRDAVLHLNNEQPLLADLFELPQPTDVGVRCTNLRTMNRQRPVFVDDSNAVFFFPYAYVRFLEIPARSAAGTDLPMPVEVAVTTAEVAEPEPIDEADLEIDEDFLRRIREV